MTYIFQWELFTIFATVATIAPSALKNEEMNGVLYPAAIVLWIASTYVWAIDSVGTPLFALTYLHLLPVVLNIAWMVLDFRRVSDDRVSKRSKYE